MNIISADVAHEMSNGHSVLPFALRKVESRIIKAASNGAKCAVIPYGTVEYNNLNKYPGMIEKIRQAKYKVLYCKLNKDMDEVVIDNIEDAAYIKVVF